MKRRTQFILTSVLVLGLVTQVSAASVLDNPSIHGQATAKVILKSTHNPGEFVSLSDAYDIEGGDTLMWNHPGVQFVSSSPSRSTVHYVTSTGFFPNGMTAAILNFCLDNKTQDNGYLLVADSDVSEWVAALGGNSKFVSVYSPRSQTTLSDQFMTDIWKVDWLPDIAALSGGKVVYKGGGNSAVLQVNADGKTATELYDVIPTPPPEASVSTAKATYTVGDNVPIALDAKVYAAATNWHFEAVQVTGPNGYSQYVQPVTQSAGPGEAAKGVSFPYYGEFGQNGFLGRVYGGGSGDPSAPKQYSETATLDTAGLAPGTYTINFTLYDAVARAASNATGGQTGTVTSTFTLEANPSQPPGGSDVPPGKIVPTPPPEPSNSGSALTMHFPLENPIGINSYGTEPVKVTNDTWKDITTTLTATIRTYIDVPYQYKYQSGTKQVQTGTDENGNPIYTEEPVYNTTTRYAMRAITGTETKTLTVPAKKSVSWDVGKNMINTIDGTGTKFQGLTPGGPWIPHGAVIPGSGAADSSSNNDGYCGDQNHMSSQIGKEDGRLWAPYLVVTAQDPQDYVSPQIDEPIITIGLKPVYPVLPVVTR